VATHLPDPDLERDIRHLFRQDLVRPEAEGIAVLIAIRELRRHFPELDEGHITAAQLGFRAVRLTG